MLEKQAKIAYLGVGSNLGDKRKNIEHVKFKLILNNIKILKSSNLYESLSWPDKRNPKFINIMLQIETYKSPKDLLTICNKIENELGRKRFKKNDPRTCDIDILDFNGQINAFKYKNLDFIVPHKKLIYRNFVLYPLKEICTNWIHPETKQNIDTLIKNLPEEDRKSILKLENN